ncbi:phage major capsid protein [Nocardioides panzhihuensis]|uniref:HK97 family phage major capsid protein n=1 Tax=Nocardioides panzhihuensis TaxID=860243 RepID=A0A7Z0ITA2_9ACTN|nr:HK97 family phage major capsid protein [Nocardioides panzhihuensis]
MATETTTTSAKAWAPDAYFAASDAVPDALINSTSTIAGDVDGDAPVVRVAYVDDAEAQITPEGDPIPEADPDLAEVLVATIKVTQLLRLSAEQWNQDRAAGMLSESVARAVTKRANLAYLQQPAPVAPAVGPTGLLNLPGVIDGGEVAGDLDALVDLDATLAGNDGTPSHVLASPTAWASLRKLKRATGSAESLLGVGAEDAVPFLIDKPVIVTNALPADTGMILDRTAVMSAIGQVVVATSEHVYFAADSIGVRCTWRSGWNVVHPERIGKFTVGLPA